MGTVPLLLVYTWSNVLTLPPLSLAPASALPLSASPAPPPALSTLTVPHSDCPRPITGGQAAAPRPTRALCGSNPNPNPKP
eukprot:scaffold5554_cov28-Phaeocystis_antarctica.AAC.1